MSTRPLVEVQRVSVRFGINVPGTWRRTTRAITAVDNVSFNINEGETLGLVGESGSGKSTLGRAILQLIRPSSGTVSFAGIDLLNRKGEELRRLRREMQIIFQDSYSALDPRMKVGALIAEPLIAHGLAKGSNSRDRVVQALESVGLDPDMADRYPREFSGGQRQRIGIARALVLEPRFLVCDEPTSSLDVSLQAQIVNLMVQLQVEFRLTYLFISHNLAVVRHVSDRVAVMYFGKIVELSGGAELYESPRHPYTVALMSAVPHADPNVPRNRIVLKGDIPNQADPQAGCSFRARCWLNERLGRPEICATTEPSLNVAVPGHLTACHFADAVGEQPEVAFREATAAAKRGVSSAQPIRGGLAGS